MTLIRGFRTELESLVGDGKGKGTSGSTMRPKVPMRQPESHCSIVAKKRSNVRGAKGAGHPRQGGVNGKPEELLVLAEAGRLPWGGTSRMNREIHVRICGRLGVKFPGPTRRDPQRAMVALLGHEAGNGGYSQRKPTAPGSPLLGVIGRTRAAADRAERNRATQ